MQIYMKKQYFFQGLDLVLEREKLGLTQAEFADRAGWTQQQQSKIECMCNHALTSELEQAFKKIGVYLEYNEAVV